MKDTKDVIALVVDKGLFPHVARRLAKDYAKVYYWCPGIDDDAFPTVAKGMMGDGFDDIIRVPSVAAVIDEVDTVVCPDIGFGYDQWDWAKRGKAVWGARHADQLEINRGLFVETLQELDMPVGKHEVITGLDDLREFLRDKEDRFIKASRWRGDIETYHWSSYDEDADIFGVWEMRLGPFKNKINFYVFERIECEFEDGSDNINIDGQWAQNCIRGFEIKNKLYLATMTTMAELPDNVRIVNDKFGPVLGEYGYRGFFSTEIRDEHFTDPTCRAGSPPSQVQTKLIANYGDMINKGANGILVEPIPAAKFGLQGILKVDLDPEHWDRLWSRMVCPPELREWVMPSFVCEVDGVYCFPPKNQVFGWLCAVGDTVKDAIDHFNELAEILPSNVSVDRSGIPELIEELEKAEEAGVELTDEPAPSVEDVTA